LIHSQGAVGQVFQVAEANRDVLEIESGGGWRGRRGHAGRL